MNQSIYSGKSGMTHAVTVNQWVLSPAVVHWGMCPLDFQHCYFTQE